MKATPALERLQRLYPRLMGDTVVPLKRGIYDELLAAHAAELAADELKEALRQHTRSTRYLQAMGAGLPRHDLSGSVVEPVSAEHRYQALCEVYRRRLSRPQARPGERRSPEQVHEHLMGQWQRRVLEAFDASGMDRSSYSEAMRGRDERANSVLDAALGEARSRAARDEALLRAFESAGLDTAGFAQTYGLHPAQALAALQRARAARAAPEPGVAARAPAEEVRQIRGVIVDLDGTMVDTLGDFVEALGRMLQDLGLTAVSAPVVERLVGKGSEHLIRSVLTHVGGSQDRYEEAWASYQRHYLAINGQHSALYPGVEAGLQRLRELGLRMACLTNKPGAFARPLLQAKGLSAYFSHAFGGDDFERKKPDPLPLLRTCEALGLQPSSVLMVGDSMNDALAARAAGCPVALVRYGYNHGQPIAEGDADQVIDSLVDLRV